ncbi:MAG: type IV secretion system protein [Smithella sp.]
MTGIDFTQSDALTAVMKLFIAKCITGSETIIPMALGLLGILACIDLALLFLYSTMDDGEDPIFLLVKGLIKYSFFAWLINNWASGMRLSKQIFDWFSLLGAKVAGSESALLNPSYIGEKGVTLAVSQFQPMFSLGIGSLGVMLLKLVLGAVLFLIFAIMAVYVFYTTLQFYVLGTITTAMLPFGANRYTHFLAQPAIGAICNVSIKMMFLQFTLCIAAPYLDSVQPFTATDTDFTNALRVIIACIGMVLFCIGTPQLAGNYFSGSPSFGDGAVGTAGRAVQSAAGAAVSAPVQAAKTGMQAFGIVQAAANVPGGRNADGKMNMTGIAKNMGTIARQKLPDRQAQWNAKSCFNVSRSLAKDRTNVDSQKK